MSISFFISGKERVSKKLLALMNEKLKNVREAVEVTQAAVVNDAKMIVPVRTGFLQSTIQPGRVKIDPITNTVDGEVVASAVYARRIEMGFENQKARPYLFPAIIKNRKNFYNRLRNALRS